MSKEKSSALEPGRQESSAVDFLSAYDVPLVSQREIKELCNRAETYLPPKRSSIYDLRFWKIALFEMAGKSPLFWMCFAVALAGGVTLLQTAMSYFSPLVLTMILSPIPFLLFVIDSLRYRDLQVIELEMTFKYDIKQLYIGKLLIGMLFSIVLILPVVFTASSVYADGWRLVLCAFTTMFFIGFVALLLIEKKPSSLPLSAFLALWVITGGLLLRQVESVQLFERLDIGLLVLAFGLSLILMALALVRTARHVRFYPESRGCS